jgi:hypothetical protein
MKYDDAKLLMVISAVVNSICHWTILSITLEELHKNLKFKIIFISVDNSEHYVY